MLESIDEKLQTNDVVKSNKKILVGIEPYNDIFYRSCFYNSFFPVIRYFNKSPLSILFNEIMIYNYDNSKEKINIAIEYLTNKSIIEVIKNTKISYVSIEESEDIVNDIISSINNNHPVIIWVDCYYESIRKDTYKKQHIPHSLLIYGYDKEKNIFNVIEHRHKDNLSYEEREIGFEDTINSYYGFIKNFKKDNTLETYYEFYIDNKQDETIEENLFPLKLIEFNNFKKDNDEKIWNQLEKLELMINDISLIVKKEELLKRYLESIISGINEIIIAKNVELYRMEKYYTNNSDKSMILSKIIESWKSVRKVLLKYMFSNKYNNSDICKLCEEIKEIYFNEKLFLTLIM